MWKQLGEVEIPLVATRNPENSPVEVGSQSTIVYKVLYIQKVVVSQISPINNINLLETLPYIPSKKITFESMILWDMLSSLKGNETKPIMAKKWGGFSISMWYFPRISEASTGMKYKLYN